MLIADSHDLPALDVVVATHDRPDLLRLALEAIGAQTYPGLITCYVVFDKTTPDLTLIRTEGNRRIKVLSNTRTPGLAGARNTGILAGSGDLVAFCDDDDEWLADKVQLQVQALRTSGSPTSVTGIFVDYGDHRTERVPTEEVMTLENLVRDRVMEAHPSTVMVVRKALLNDIGLVDEQIPGSFGEDYDWIIRAAQVGRFAVVEQALVNVRWGQSLFSQKWQTIIDAIDYLLDKHPAFREDNRALGRLYGQQAFARAALGEHRAALRGAVRTVRTSPREKRAYLAGAVACRVVSAERLMDIAHRRGHGI